MYFSIIFTDFEYSMVVGARPAVLGLSETADLPEFTGISPHKNLNSSLLTSKEWSSNSFIYLFIYFKWVLV